jgi:hypothetical protein
MQKLLKESAKVLEEIKAEAIMSAILALFSVIILGSIAALSVDASIKIILVCLLPLIFVFLTVVYSLIIKEIRNLFIWLSEYRKPKRKANLKFDTISEDNQRFYFLVQNKELWNNVDEIKVFWDDIASTLDVPNEPFQELKNWRVNRKALEWRVEKKDTTTIPKRKSKTAYFFEIHKKRNMFSIHANDCEPIYFPVGGYIFFLSVTGKVSKKVVENKIRIEFEYKGGIQYKIGTATTWQQ